MFCLVVGNFRDRGAKIQWLLRHHIHSPFLKAVHSLYIRILANHNENWKLAAIRVGGCSCTLLAVFVWHPAVAFDKTAFSLSISVMDFTAGLFTAGFCVAVRLVPVFVLRNESDFERCAMFLVPLSVLFYFILTWGHFFIDFREKEREQGR